MLILILMFIVSLLIVFLLFEAALPCLAQFSLLVYDADDIMAISGQALHDVLKLLQPFDHGLP